MGKRKRKKEKWTCYMCSKVATSREHVPPLCFFPEEVSLRKNLITVPSCDEHNLSKSGDDEYLLAIVTSHIENNRIAQDLFRSKVVRAVKRRSWLLPTFFHNLLPVRVGRTQTGSFRVDKRRFDRSFDGISRGIYYHHFKKKVKLPSATMSYSLLDNSSDEANAIMLEWRKYSTKELARLPRFGENPVVYYYQVVEDRESGGVAIRHVFYEGVVVDVLFGTLNEISNTLSAA